MTALAMDRALRQATDLHRRGELADAEAAYRRILEKQPAHSGALHGFGLLALQAGRADVAIATIGQAARLVPENAAYHLDLGLALRDCRHLEEARAAFHVAALLDPADPVPIAAMADMLARLERLPEAAAAYRQALALAPLRADFQHALGLVLRAQGRHRPAAEAFAAAVALSPDDVAMRCDLAGALLDDGTPEAAERELHAALAIHPGHAGALNNLGLALQDLERPAEALSALQAAERAAPDHPGIRNNLGVALRDLDRNAEALACFDAVLESDPVHAPAHLNAASVTLMRGEFERGWAEFEWRDRVPGAVPRRFAQPRWQGEPLAGRVLLAHAEMGLGDTIQFCRFVSRVERRVLLQAPAPLGRLLAGLPGVAAVAHEPVEHFDLHCPLPSLPHLLGVRLSDLAGGEPYLRADPDAVARWQSRVAALPGRRVGVCWAGSSAYAYDRRRSLPPAQLARLAAIPGISLVSLQVGAAVPDGIGMTDWTDELADFADTAALMQALDVVVSVDTAVVHLAGALGRPVLLLDRFAGDWRWMRNRCDSPWYGSLRILRQTAPGDWNSVLDQVVDLLS